MVSGLQYDAVKLRKDILDLERAVVRTINFFDRCVFWLSTQGKAGGKRGQEKRVLIWWTRPGEDIKEVFTWF